MEVIAEFDSGISARPMLFSANGECIVSGDERNVRVWKLSDRTKIQSLTAGIVNCLAISRNGRWIAAGTLPNDIIIWSVQQRYKKSRLGNQYPPSVALDFSPDSESRHLLIAGFDSSLSIFDLLHHRRVLSVSLHPEEITAAKYSPQGDRFAVATGGFVRIYDRDSMELLMAIRAQVIPWYNTGLLWSNNDLFIVSERSIKRIDTVAGEVTSEWQVPGSDRYSCIQTIRQQDRELIVYSTEGGVTIWDTSNGHSQFHHIQHPQAISSVAISPDQQYLAIGGEKGKITVRRLPHSLTVLPPEPGPTPDPIPPKPRPSTPTLDPSRLIPSLDLIHWVRDKLVRSSWQDALASASLRDSTLRFTVCRAICERLDEIDRVKDATDCFHRAESEPTVDAGWIMYFKARCTVNLEHCGDTSIIAGRYDDAISWYSAALSLSPALPQSLLVRRSQAYLAIGSWENALQDADKVIALDESSPWGYERKHAALHFGRDYKAAASAFEKMFSLMSPPSPDPTIRELHPRYTINPAKTKTAISQVIQEALSETPRVLIDTESGDLFDQAQREAWFKSLQIFNELVSSMTIQIDITRIKNEVAMRYRYATFSHTWAEGEDEPSFKNISQVVVYDLPASRTHDKLKMFCITARQAGLCWAWSDTCCINKSDNAVLQEALVAMFRWYHGSSLTIVFLCDVRSPSRRGDLARSRWNTRAWTFQEYHASRVVRFYNADWTPYLNLDIPNHKESPDIISEMEQATGVTARSLATLKPGLNDIREKLCLASQRKTTQVEDAAYSLLGIFSQPLTPMYGEGDMALGRLLSHLLTNSGDTSILAWTGKSNEFNSCLPSKITVFQHFPPPYIPLAIDSSAPEAMVNNVRNAKQFTAQAMKLHGKLKELPVPSFSDRRMRLPCIAFELGSAVRKSAIAPEHVFCVQTDALGVVEITTTEDLSQFHSLTLVHPWIDFLLDRRPLAIGGVPDATVGVRRPRRSSSVYTTFTTSSSSHSGPSSRRPPQPITEVHPASPPDLVPNSPKDKETKALQLVARLRQRFGALLLTPAPENVNVYKRVAAEREIIVQVKEGTSLKALRDSTRILDVL